MMNHPVCEPLAHSGWPLLSARVTAALQSYAMTVMSADTLSSLMSRTAYRAWGEPAPDT
jgi:hypothetical protein